MLLAELSEAMGVSGHENEVRRIIRRELDALGLSSETDALGNVLTRARSAHGSPDAPGAQRQAPRVLVTAHMDEVGFIVSRIEESGVLRFKAVGGIDHRLLPGKAVWIGPKRVAGVIGSKPIHLTEASARTQAPEAKDLYIDIGAKNKSEAEKAVSVGDFATFASRFETWHDRLFKGKALDDRCGCYMLLQILKKAIEEDWPTEVHAAFTAQEEIGLRGAGVAAYRVDPDIALVLEVTTCADTPGTDPHGQSTVLGHGPALTFMDARHIPDRHLVRHLVATAERHHIPYQWKRTTMGGTDAGAIHKVRGGVLTASLSLPGRYIHGPSALVSKTDLEHGLALASAFLRELPESWPHLARVSNEQTNVRQERAERE